MLEKNYKQMLEKVAGDTEYFEAYSNQSCTLRLPLQRIGACHCQNPNAEGKNVRGLPLMIIRNK